MFYCYCCHRVRMWANSIYVYCVPMAGFVGSFGPGLCADCRLLTVDHLHKYIKVQNFWPDHPDYIRPYILGTEMLISGTP